MKHDLYTVPAAHTELGLLYIATGKLLEAQRRLETARCVPLHPCMLGKKWLFHGQLLMSHTKLCLLCMEFKF